jgi:preprotein translocase subunit Sec61beta
MAQDKVRLPSGSGGLVQYYDEYKSKIEFKPGTVVLFIILVVLIEFLLHLYGNAIFG